MLLQVRKKWKGVDMLMASLYDYPTLRGYAAEIDRALDPQGRVLDFESTTNGTSVKQDEHYSHDAQELATNLPTSFPKGKVDITKPLTVLLTGATGYLGAYILREILNRTTPSFNVIAHVRVRDTSAGLERIIQTCSAYGIWSESWRSRLSCVTGDLEKPRLGLDSKTWENLASKVDIIIHNGARVHWVSPYPSLRAANVLSTLAVIELASLGGRPKHVTFVSSTAVLDSDYYAQLSEDIIAKGGEGIPESDDLQGSAKGLGGGYGQTKWSSEYLMREAGKKGMKGCIVRPGYVTGDSTTGSKSPSSKKKSASLQGNSILTPPLLHSINHRRLPDTPP